MYLEQRVTPFTPPQFNLSTNTILGTIARWQIERTWPIEEILVQVNFTVTTALAPTPRGNAALTTPDIFDNIMQLVSRITLSVNDRSQPRNVIDVSGVGLLEHVSQSGFNLDTATLELLGSSQANGAPNIPTGAYTLTYRIPMVFPGIGEPLRTRMYLPVHKMLQDPILSLQFNTLAGMGFTAGAIGAVFVDTVLIRRLPTAASEQLLASTNDPDNPNPYGYIDFDIIETPYSIAPGIGTEQRFALPIPGNYIALTCRQYLGGAAISRNVIDNSGIGSTTGTGFGAESLWRLESGQIVIRNWKWKHLRTINDYSRPQVGNGFAAFVAAASAGSPTSALNINPNFPDVRIASTNFRSAGSTQLNFLTDGLSGDSGNELGSLLDCNTPNNNGLKMELIGTPANVATNASYLYVVGHRLFGGIGRWQKF